MAAVRTAPTAMVAAVATSTDAVNDTRTAFPQACHGQLNNGLRLPLLLRRREVVKMHVVEKGPLLSNMSHLGCYVT